MDFSKTPVLVFLVVFLAVLPSCAPHRPERKEFSPDKAVDFSIPVLDDIAAFGDYNAFPSGGVKLTGYVGSRYQGGPVGKELLGLKAFADDPGKAVVYCLRVIPPGGSVANLGEQVTVAGFVAPSSSKGNIFLNDCVVISKNSPPFGK